MWTAQREAIVSSCSFNGSLYMFSPFFLGWEFPTNVVDSGCIHNGCALLIKGESHIMYVVPEVEVSFYDLLNPRGSAVVVICVVAVQLFNPFWCNLHKLKILHRVVVSSSGHSTPLDSKVSYVWGSVMVKDGFFCCLSSCCHWTISTDFHTSFQSTNLNKFCLHAVAGLTKEQREHNKTLFPNPNQNNNGSFVLRHLSPVHESLPRICDALRESPWRVAPEKQTLKKYNATISKYIQLIFCYVI